MRFQSKLAAIMAVLAIWPAVTVAVPVVSLNNPGSTTLHEVTVAPGGTFSIDLNLNADMQLNNIMMLTVQANASNVFDVVQVSPNPPWTGNNNMIGGVDPVSNRFDTFLPAPLKFGPGITTLASIKLSVDEITFPGLYTLDVRAFYYSGTGGPIEDFHPALSGPLLAVHVIPEPATIVMLVALGLFIASRRF